MYTHSVQTEVTEWKMPHKSGSDTHIHNERVTSPSKNGYVESLTVQDQSLSRPVLVCYVGEDWNIDHYKNVSIVKGTLACNLR